MGCSGNTSSAAAAVRKLRSKVSPVVINLLGACSLPQRKLVKCGAGALFSLTLVSTSHLRPWITAVPHTPTRATLRTPYVYTPTTLYHPPPPCRPYAESATLPPPSTFSSPSPHTQQVVCRQELFGLKNRGWCTWSHQLSPTVVYCRLLSSTVIYCHLRFTTANHLILATLRRPSDFQTTLDPVDDSSTLWFAVC